MSTHDLTVDNQTMPNARADINSALQAIGSQQAGTADPPATFSYERQARTDLGVVRRRNAANSGWLLDGTLAETFLVDRASNTILGEADFERTFRATASFTQTLTAAATLGDGWCVGYIAQGNLIVLDPNGSETIDGATTKSVTGSGFIFCNGVAFYTVGFPAASIGIVNGLINGGMEVWQRGTSIAVAASSSGYGTDRWVLATGANQAHTMSQIAGLTNGSQFGAQVQRNNGQTGTGTITFEQPFELSEIVKWRGQTLSASFVAATGANWSPASGTLNVSIVCGTGAARPRGLSAYTGETLPLNNALFNIAAGTAAAQYSATAAAIIPTNTTQMTAFFTWSPVGTAGANDYIQLDDVMLSDTIGAGFERRLVEAELVLCKRYFRKTFPLGTTPAQNTGSYGGALMSSMTSAVIGAAVNWPWPMRTTPTTVTTYNVGAADANWRNEGNTGSATAAVAQKSDENVTIYSSNAPTSDRYYIHATADAELY